MSGLSHPDPVPTNLRELGRLLLWRAWREAVVAYPDDQDGRHRSAFALGYLESAMDHLDAYRLGVAS